MHFRGRHGIEKAPNELNYALPWLLMGQIQKTSRYFLSKQEKKPSRDTVLLMLLLSSGNSVPAITDFHSWCLLHTVLNY
jgi:hypothetical protein